VFSMLLSMGVYWTVFGWWFAAGLIASIYIHEMGHVAALHRLGIRASAPMFIPGIGAMVRLHEYPAGPREDSRVGLAGPLYGLGAVVVFYCAYLATDIPHLAAIARVGAWLNLFNLLPVWQLDGSRGLRSLSSWQRWAVVGAMFAMWFATGETLLLALGVVAGFRSATSEAAEEADPRGLADYLILVVGLAAFCALEVPGNL
jgi:Zn-dependent protease